MSMFKMKSMFAIGFAFTALLSTFSSIFEGRVVAKLPFTPISWFQGLSHRSVSTSYSVICDIVSKTASVVPDPLQLLCWVFHFSLPYTAFRKNAANAALFVTLYVFILTVNKFFLTSMISICI